MKYNKSYLTSVILLISTCFSSIFSQEIMIAAGAGYKKPVHEMANNFEESTKTNVTEVYGNIQMITNQARQTEEIACVIGDKKFLKKMESTVSFTSYTKLGDGILVLAYRKGLSIKDINDITSPSIKSIFMPQETKAIYGIAGKEALLSLKLADKIANKLTQVATVPQVVSYLLTEEADAGFINLTEALANKDKLGGYIIVPHENYKPIEIVAGVVEGFEGKSTTNLFIQYIKTEEAKKTLNKFGL